MSEETIKNNNISPLKIKRKMIVLAIFTLLVALLLIIPSISFVCLNKKWVYVVLALSAVMIGLNILSLYQAGMRKFVYEANDFVAIFQIALLLVILVFSYVAYPIRVQQVSMKPTLTDGESLIALSTTTHSIERFDIVVACVDSDINTIGDTGVADGTYIIKRVIGMPGDEIVYSSLGLYINGEYISEDYIYDGMTGRGYIGTVPEGCYFLMGDNRTVSVDSRSLGSFSKQQIIGIAKYRVGLFYWKGIE